MAQTIGFLTPIVNTPVDTNLWLGIKDFCAENNLNLITLVGGRFKGKTDREIQRLTLFNDFDYGMLDGLIIWASNVFTYADDQFKIDFYKKFGNKPAVNLQLPVGSHPTILSDDYQAVKMLVDHMIKVHKYKNIGFIRGPESHILAQARYKAYRDALTYNNYAMNEKLITDPGPWSNRSDKASVHFLDKLKLKPKVDIDAVVSCNAVLAKELIRDLIKRDIKVPGDIAVTGFNDDKEAACMSPSLTTVDSDFYKMGYKSGELILKIINGGRTDDIVHFEADLIIRNSCGCLNESIAGMIDDGNFAVNDRSKNENYLNENRDNIISGILDRLKAAGNNRQLLGELYGLILSDGGNTGKTDHAFRINNLINSYISNNNDLQLLNKFLNFFHKEVFVCLSDKKKEMNFISSCQMIMSMAYDGLAKKTAYDTLKEVKVGDFLNNLDDHMLNSFDINHSLDILKSDLEKIDIRGLYVFTNDDKENFSHYQMICGYNGINKTDLKICGDSVDFKGIFGYSLKSVTEPYCILAQALYFKNEKLGIALFIPEQREGRIYEVVRSNISSIIKGSGLLASLENSQASLKKRNEEIVLRIRPMIEKFNEISGKINYNKISLNKTGEITDEGFVKLQTTNALLKNIEININKLSNVVRIISEISHAVRILSINTAIISARSGDQGKAFGVIAKEIRKLSDLTGKNVKEIAFELDHIIKSILESVRSSDETLQIFNEIKTGVKELISYMINLSEDISGIDRTSKNILEMIDN